MNFNLNCFQVKIQGQNEEMLLAACEQFLGKNEEEIQQVRFYTRNWERYNCDQKSKEAN
jgi:hypothetical protein